MAMTLRLTDDETEALRRRAELLDQVLNEELPRYAEALDRLGR
jgi:Trp operon repressor